MNDQRWHVYFAQVVAEVLMPRWHAGEAGRGRGAGCEVPAGLHGLFADTLAEQKVRVVEVLEKVGEERVTICDDRFLNPVEDAAVHAFRIVRRLQQERRHPRNDYSLTDRFRSIFPEIARHLAATHGKTDQCEVAQFKLRHELVQILSETVIAVAGCWLAGLAESSSVIIDDTVTCIQKNWHLLLPGGTAQRISVNQDDGTTRTVILVVEVDVAGVFLPDRNVWHWTLLFRSI